MNIKIKLYLSFFLFFVVCGSAFAQQPPASRAKETDYVFDTYEQNYDSLLCNLISNRAIKQHQRKYLNVNIQYDNSTYTPDSVYIRRLSRIPSVIPLSYNEVVRSYIEAYVKRYRQSVNLMLTLSEYYFPMFEDAFDKRGVPLEIKYLAIIESALNPIALSRAGASGLWQFMYATGKSYGLEINSLVDERRDPIKSTNAAASYLKDLYNIYGDWQLALAAYNCGPGNVNKAMRRSGKTSYWDIYEFLPAETRGYVPAYIAATYVMNYYKMHGIQPTNVELPIATDTVWVNEDIHMQQISQVINVSIDQLRSLNPQYRSDIIPGKTKPYILILPIRSSIDFIASYDSIINYKSTSFFQPTATTINRGSGDNNNGYEKVYYTVKRGETWVKIASRYGVNVSDLKRWNGRKSNKLSAGTRLIVYKYSPINTVKSTSTSTSEEVASTTTNTPQQETQKPKTTETRKQPAKKTYTVRNGDSFYKIAQKNNMSMDKLLKLNGMTKKSKIYAGQVLKVQ